jgi:hypothetical protein
VKVQLKAFQKQTKKSQISTEKGRKRPRQGTLNEGEGRLSTVDLLIKVACFVKK